MGLASEALRKKLGKEVFEGVWKLVSWDETFIAGSTWGLNTISNTCLLFFF